MKKLLIVLAILFAHHAYSQVPPRDSLVGVWLCNGVKMVESAGIPEGQRERVKQMMNTLQSSSFEFKANGLFEWHFQGKANEFTQMLSFLSNHKWYVDAAKSVIRIGEVKENLAEIQVIKKNGNIFFLMSETPLLFLVVKN